MGRRFFRRQTPGHFMMRLRIPNGILSAMQLRSILQAPALGMQLAAPRSRKCQECRFAVMSLPKESDHRFWRKLK